MLNGLELSRIHYREHCAPMLAERFPLLQPRIAVGLVGDGSECFGFDDKISRDHDWGAALCLWLGKEDFDRHGGELAAALADLPDKVRGLPVRVEAGLAAGRSGVLEIGNFYFRYLGSPAGPTTLREWLLASEERLAVATNGEVFADPSGEFTAIRNRLLAFYPEDVRLKKLANRCAIMAQAGQYNFSRCMDRKEHVAAAMALAEFFRAACSAFFLLARRYMPYYKWMHRALALLPGAGAEAAGILASIARASGDNRFQDMVEMIESCCILLADELHAQGLSDATDAFLLEHARSVQRRIVDEGLRSMDVFVG